MTRYIDEIVSLEWTMFDRVHNRGGRAACQDDQATFVIMRSSQFMAWNDTMRESYLSDLRAAQRQGRNLLSEKYGYMMARTAPEEFSQIRDRLPDRDPEKDAYIAEICAMHIAWLEDVAERYPHLAGRGRAIHSSEDSAVAASFETYLWGELSTYSVETLRRYAAYVAKLRREGENMNEMVLQNTVMQYGYVSLKAAEEQLSSKRKNNGYSETLSDF